MTRNHALQRLTARLTARRDALRKTLAQDLEGFRNEARLSIVGDSVDAALETAHEEISSQIVELECRELAQIEHALRRIAAGAYGRCEGCGCKISAGRLSVLPCTSCCIDCQRKREASGAAWLPATAGSRWERVDDSPSEGGASDTRIDWNDFKTNLSEMGSMAVESAATP